MKTYTGGCHCGAVRYEVEMEPQSALVCNCSHCHKAGLSLTFLPASHFKLLQGEDAQTEYRFNKKTIAHLFCKTCGIQSFARAKSPEGVDTIALNLRTVDNLNLDSIPVETYNGKDI